MLNKPRVITWRYSGKCNMKCRFCYSAFNPDRLTLPQKHYIVDKIGNAKIPKLTLTGGEPLVDKGIYEVIDHSKERGLFVSLHTNGLLLDKKGLNRLEGKIGRISLALDGSTNEMNHIMRSERGYLDIVTGLMKQIKERGIPISIKTVASRKNIKDIPHMVEILAKYSPDVWLITQFTPNNRGDRYREEFEISNDEFQRLRTKIKGTPFKVALRSSEITTTLPFFFLDSNGGVLTASAKNPKGEINIGSIFKQEIEELWKKIASINKVNQYYMENIWTERIY